MNLSKAEEIIMEVIWKKGKVFFKALLEELPEPKPAPTTLATLLTRMQKKKCIGYTLYGNSREYYPLVKREDYFSKQVNEMIEQHFDNSALQFASFFTNATRLSKKELEALRQLIDQRIKKKQK
ncbi:MAG: BlaI/MecI/CopY family transcriptional regulator [Chitinophagaceae bacterium]|nr:BlaI/MecI/CopY family transcriptional regulator [Chitinophagaceae bacterium]